MSAALSVQLPADRTSEASGGGGAVSRRSNKQPLRGVPRAASLPVLAIHTCGTGGQAASGTQNLTRRGLRATLTIVGQKRTEVGQVHVPVALAIGAFPGHAAMAMAI